MSEKLKKGKKASKEASKGGKWRMKNVSGASVFVQ